MKPAPRTGLRSDLERLLRRLGLLPPEPEVVIARVPRRRPVPWPPPQ